MLTVGRKKREEISAEDRVLLEELFSTKTELDGIRQKFDYVTEPEMVASCIYEMRSAQERYSYLLGRVRAKELRLADRRSFLWKE